MRKQKLNRTLLNKYKIKKNDFVYYSIKELVELDVFLDKRYYKNTDIGTKQGNKSIQVLLETLSGQMSYEFYSL